MKDIKLIALDVADFKKELVFVIKDALEKFEKDKVPQTKIEYLTRDDVVELLKISETTLYRWTKNGRLTSYGLGNRVYYKREEIEEAIITLNPRSHD